MSTTTAKVPSSKTATKSAKSTKTTSKPSTPASSSTRKPTGTAPTSAVTGSAPKAAPTAAPKVVDAPQPVIMGPMLRKKELVDLVVTRSGMKKKDVKPVVESMLEVLGEALADNRELNLQPFGRLKVRKERKLSSGRMIVTKIRQNMSSDGSKKSETPK